MPPGGMMGFGRGSRSFLTEEEKKNQPKVTKELVLRVMSYLGPYKKQLFFALLCILCSSVLTLMPSILTGKIIDEGLIGRDFNKLVFYIVLSLLVTAAANLIGVLENYLNSWMNQFESPKFLLIGNHEENYNDQYKEHETTNAECIAAHGSF